MAVRRPNCNLLCCCLLNVCVCVREGGSGGKSVATALGHDGAAIECAQLFATPLAAPYLAPAPCCSLLRACLCFCVFVCLVL